MKKALKRVVSMVLCFALLGGICFASADMNSHAATEENYVIEFTKKELRQGVSSSHTYADSQYNNCAATEAEIVVNAGYTYIYHSRCRKTELIRLERKHGAQAISSSIIRI